MKGQCSCGEVQFDMLETPLLSMPAIVKIANVKAVPCTT